MNNSFTNHTENTNARASHFKYQWRYLTDLSLTIKLTPLIIILVALATALPQVFIWYAGELVQCLSNSSHCSVTIEKIFPMTIAITPIMFLSLILASLLARVAAWIVFEVSAQITSIQVYRKMIAGLANVRVTYFDQNPSGHILNRLIGDFEKIRVMGVLRLGDTFNCMAELIFIALLIVFSSPLATALIFPILFFFFYLQRLVSPMLEHLSAIISARNGELLHRETDLIEGARIFSLYGKQNSILQRISDIFRRIYSANYAYSKIYAWHRFWMGIIALAYTSIVIFVLIAALENNSITQAMTAVILTAVFRITPTFQWLFDSSSRMAAYEANAKRIYEIVDLPAEVSTEFALESRSEKQKLPPKNGNIEFKNFSMSYRADSPIILDNINLTLNRGHKIGIIGRTGSGKSSVIQSLFRMAFVQQGDILIGNQSIFDSDITQHRLRIGIVPQQPFLFGGSLRENLDRAGQCTDDILKSALKSVGLTFDLDLAITEGGTQFSLGERQLLCIARILASDKQIVIMDEPTSSVDPITDERIQKILATAFDDKTVITIAHRLETLLLCDEVLELSDGKIVFQGPPEAGLSRWKTLE